MELVKRKHSQWENYYEWVFSITLCFILSQWTSTFSFITITFLPPHSLTCTSLFYFSPFHIPHLLYSIIIFFSSSTLIFFEIPSISNHSRLSPFLFIIFAPLFFMSYLIQLAFSLSYHQTFVLPVFANIYIPYHKWPEQIERKTHTILKYL